MKLFRLLEVWSGKPQIGKGYRVKRLKKLPFGEALMHHSCSCLCQRGSTVRTSRKFLNFFDENYSVRNCLGKAMPAWEFEWLIYSVLKLNLWSFQIKTAGLTIYSHIYSMGRYERSLAPANQDRERVPR